MGKKENERYACMQLFVRGGIYTGIVSMFTYLSWWNPDHPKMDCWVAPGAYQCGGETKDAVNMTLRWIYLFRFGMVTWGMAFGVVLVNHCIR